MRLIKGFTLIELLVVIAIIGILSSVAVINLSSSKTKARNAVVFKQLSDLAPVIFVCLSNNSPLYCNNLPPADNWDNICGPFPHITQPPNNGQGDDGPLEICPGSNTYWPDLEQHSWQYNSVIFSTSTMSWTIEAQEPDLLSVTITCGHTGCTKEGF